MSAANKASFREDILAAVDPANENVHFSVGLRAAFERDYPDTAKQAGLTQFKTLDLNNLHDCKTAG